MRRYLYSDDPTVKVASGLSEPDAEMARDLLSDEGIRLIAKNMNFLSVANIGGVGNDYDLWVRRSDVEQARELLEAVLSSEQLVDVEEPG
ncbi:MAG: DUF2007 domain-containing protein [Dehalococcoidia bacterium]